MLKQVLVLTGAALLAACSSGSSTPSTPAVDPPGGTGTGTGTGTVNPGGVTRAGAYVGDFGSGNGVYVLSAGNALSGLALSADGSAQSLFGELGAGNTFQGDARSYFHGASDPANQGVFSAGEAGANSPAPAATAFNLNIVDGQTIESLSGNPVSLSAAGAGALASSTPASIAGAWSGRHRYCADETDLVNNCSVLLTEITFAGTSVSGRTVVLTPAGEESFANPIAGSIAEIGELSALTFTWNGMSYNGSVFFMPGDAAQLVFLGETRTAGAGNPTIATLLTR